MAEGVNRDWKPGEYDRAYAAIRDLAEALGTMQFPDPKRPDQDANIGSMFESVLGSITATVANHQRVIRHQEMIRPAAGLLTHDGCFIPGSITDGKFTPS